MTTRNNRTGTDAHRKALPDEPTFTLLARDPAAPAAIEAWMMARVRMFDAHPPMPASERSKHMEAIRCADAMVKWRADPANTARVAVAKAGPDPEPVAWSYELAGSYSTITGEYSNWMEPRLSFTKPNVPVGSIRNLVALWP